MSSHVLGVGLSGSRRRTASHGVRDPVLAGVLAALTVWGVVPFGSVHDWALWPLVAGVLLTGSSGLLTSSRAGSRPILLAALPLLGMVLLQLLPFPVVLIDRVSSGTATFLAQYDVSVASGLRTVHTLSVSPQLTVRAVLIFVSLVILVAGVSTYLTNRDGLLRRLVVSIAFVAVGVALLGLVQKATSNGKIYWFWESQFRVANNYFGPFVNRNHFAGWMLLPLSLTTGLFLAQLQACCRGTKHGWRNRLLWLGSDEAGRLVLTGAATFVMLLSILWSMSRSGMAAAALAVGILSATAMYRLGRSARRKIAIGSLAFLGLVAAAWRGLETLTVWYGQTQTFEWRVRLWKDTFRPLRDFWLFGSGMNTYGRVMLLYPQTDESVHAVQAHNDYLQLAVEGGVLVGIPALFLIRLLVRQVNRRLTESQDEMTWWTRMGAVAGMCGMALQEMTEFSLQIPGVAVLFAIVIAVAIHEPAALAATRIRRVHPNPRYT